MATNNEKFIFVGVCLLVLYAQVQETMSQSVSQQCLDCICEAASGCDDLTGCIGDVCGPYRITQVYWCDSGKPGLENNPNDAHEAFQRCVGDRACATRAVQGYMNRYARDCNGDGAVDCDDYALIHRLGGVGCNGTAVPEFQNAYENCIRPGASAQRSGGMMQPGASPQASGGMPYGGSAQTGGGMPYGASAQGGGGMQYGASAQGGGGMPYGGSPQPNAWPQPAQGPRNSCNK